MNSSLDDSNNPNWPVTEQPPAFVCSVLLAPSWYLQAFLQNKKKMGEKVSSGLIVVILPTFNTVIELKICL